MTWVVKASSRSSSWSCSRESNLRHRQKGERLASRKAIDYAVQIAHGLAAAHDKGVVHRDLKPENLFVLPDGRVKILDFGLARKVEVLQAEDNTASFENEDTGTRAGTVVGTVGYMSPEQVRGEVLDPRSDIFSLGSVIYEMVSGGRAFLGRTAVEIQYAILNCEPSPIATAEAPVAAALERIVHRCMEKSREERFRSAHDLAFALESLSETRESSSVSVVPGSHRSRRVFGPPRGRRAGDGAAGGSAPFEPSRRRATGSRRLSICPLRDRCGLEGLARLVARRKDPCLCG